MSTCLPLCHQLYKTIVETPYVKLKIVQLIPPTEDISDLFSTFQTDNDTIDIGLTKKTYLSIFKETHTFWHSNLVPFAPDFEEYWLDDDEKLKNAYYMTIGYLITTNENHTIIRLHELLWWQIWKKSSDRKQLLVSQFEILTVFISSRLKRINKSSSLWLMVKKIAIALILNDMVSSKEKCPVEMYRLLIHRVIMSCKVHFANYYASNFLKWCIRFNSIVSKIHEDSEVRSAMASMNCFILENLVAICRENLSDVSLWTTLEVYLRECNKHPDVSEYTIGEYNAIIDQLSTLSGVEFHKITVMTIKTTPEFDSENFLLNQITWLLKANCTVLTPYIAILNPSSLSSGKIPLELHNVVKNAREQERKKLDNFQDNINENAMFISRKKYVSILDHLLLQYSI